MQTLGNNMSGSKILKRGYKAKLKRDLVDAVDIGDFYHAVKNRYLNREELKVLIDILRESDEVNVEELQAWYKENFPEAIQIHRELERELEQQAREEEQSKIEEK